MRYVTGNLYHDWRRPPRGPPDDRPDRSGRGSGGGLGDPESSQMAEGGRDMGDMKPKYTPGPWHVVPIGNPKKEMTPVVKATDCDLILMAYVWTRGQPNEANARLIAE